MTQTAHADSMTPMAQRGLRRAELIALAGLVLLAIAIRGAFHFRTLVFLEGDSQSYLLPAWDLLNGGNFALELRRAPVYPLFIAGSFAIAGLQLETLAAVQHLLGVVTVVLTYLLARRWLGILPSIFAAGLIAVSGPLLIYERYVMSETLFGTLLTATVLMLVLAIQKDDLRLFAASGLLVGVDALCRPVAQALLLLVPMLVLVLMGRDRRSVLAAGVTVVAMLAVLGPWAVRNMASHGTVSSAGGLGRSLIARTVKYDEGFFNSERIVRPGETATEIKPEARQIVYRKRNNVRKGRSVRPVSDAIVEELNLTPGQADAVMRDIAVEAIMERPGYYLLGTGEMIGQIFVGRDERLAGHWRQRAEKDWDEQWETQLEPLITRVTPAQQLGYPVSEALASMFQPAKLGPLLPTMALFGVLLGMRDRNRRMVLLPAAVTLTLVSLAAALDGPVPRYRYPVDPLLAVSMATLLPTLAIAANRVTRRSRLTRAESRAAS
jgi:4-amino-4-deoxy-L-arabinose transferase-like glycosyltransferase